MWSMFDYEPVYDGNFAGAPEVFERYWQRTGEPNDAEELLASKKCWLKSQG